MFCYHLFMPKLEFKATMKIRKGNPYLLVNAARIRSLKPGWRKPLPVLIRINGKPTFPWRIHLMPVGNGSFYLYLHGDVRKASKTKVGDRVEVEVVFDPADKNGPMYPMLPRFRTALNKNVKAKRAWEALIPSRKKEILRYLSRLKSPETQVRNVKRALRVLSGRTERFMARSWSNGV